MLQITPSAAHHLVRVRNAEGIDAEKAARFTADGEWIGLTFTSTPQRGDRQIETSAISVFVAPNLAPRLEEAVMDTREKEGKKFLVIRGIAPAQRGVERIVSEVEEHFAQLARAWET